MIGSKTNSKQPGQSAPLSTHYRANIIVAHTYVESTRDNKEDLWQTNHRSTQKSTTTLHPPPLPLSSDDKANAHLRSPGVLSFTTPTVSCSYGTPFFLSSTGAGSSCSSPCAGGAMLSMVVARSTLLLLNHGW